MLYVAAGIVASAVVQYLVGALAVTVVSRVGQCAFDTTRAVIHTGLLQSRAPNNL